MRRWILVAGDSDGALDEEEVGLAGLEEDDDVAAVHLAIEGEGCPLGGRSKRDTVDEDVIADKERLDHGGRGDLEVLEYEGHDEEAYSKDAGDGGQGLEWCLVVFFVNDWFGRGFDRLRGCVVGHAVVSVSLMGRVVSGKGVWAVPGEEQGSLHFCGACSARKDTSLKLVDDAEGAVPSGEVKAGGGCSGLV